MASSKRPVNLALLGAPFRFGNSAVDEAELARHVAARQEQLAAQLLRVRGCVEMTVKLAAEPQPA